MLEGLFGNPNVQNILLFLFVNGKGYGTQLHKQLKTALTPIQKALSRLEKGGIIISYYEGKTRLYQLNPACPIIYELEQLLRKLYTLLPPQEKKAFCALKEESPTREINKPRTLAAFWEKLKGVKQLTFQARTKSKDPTGWDGKGKGFVQVTEEVENRLVFIEKGSWSGRPGKEIGFSNQFCWTLDKDQGMISLEHLRYGWANPVFLFHLVPTGQHSLSSVDSHLCDGDTYFGRVHFDRYTLRLTWRVIGPKKNEELDYFYS